LRNISYLKTNLTEYQLIKKRLPGYIFYKAKPFCPEQVILPEPDLPATMNRNQKIALGAAAVFAGTLFLLSCRQSKIPLETVPRVNLEKYMGTWYEIASFPQWFQKGCHCTKAEYTVAKKGYVRVINSCRKNSPTGKLKTAEGKAFVVEGSNNSKLKVQFQWPFKGDYWIIDLAPDYSYAIVSEPKREALWILSRKPNMDPELYLQLVNSLKERHFDISKLQLSDQSCQE
jgi:apolipoprotein D and lipocalin family protein